MSTGDKLAAAKAANRDMAMEKPRPKQDCREVVNISVFFDGTGNNKFVDETDSKWSNPARLWRAAQYRTGPDTNNHAIYVAGVGTPFNGTATDWMLDRTLVSLQDSGLGAGTGTGGTRRSEYGHTKVNDRLRAVLSQSAGKLNVSLAPYLQKGKPANIRGLAAAIEAAGLATVINLSIFGFSRGAALARAFCNEMVKECAPGPDGMLRYNGISIRFHFMGLFDTVASFGVASANVDMPFDEKNLVVPRVVEHCVHYVAAHELRFSFPVDLIRKDGKLMPNWIEKVYPGAHSDVGGGYPPISQGIHNNYARIPMRDMMDNAVKNGVRMVDYDDIAKRYGDVFSKVFKIESDTQAAFDQYMAAIGSSASVDQSVTAHMKALYSSWGTMTRLHIKTPDLVEVHARTGAFAHAGHPGIAKEAAAFLNAEKMIQYVERTIAPDSTPRAMAVEGRTLGLLVRPANWRLEAWQATASRPIMNFIQHYIHDSKAGFLHAIEPFSYFAARGMAESSRNVLACGLGWLDDQLEVVKRGVIKVYHRAEGVVVETWAEGKLIATCTYQVGQKFVVETVQAGIKFTIEVYQSSKEILISTVKKGEQMVITSVDLAKRHARAAGKATQKTASELADATRKKLNEFAEATQKTAGEVGNQIYSGTAEAGKTVGQATDMGMHAVEDGWNALRTTLGF